MTSSTPKPAAVRPVTPFAALLLAAVVLLAPTGASAQQEGRVLTPLGQPLPNVVVEVWGRAVVFHVGRTDAEGRFELPPARGLRVTRYVFRHLGFATVIVQADDFTNGMDVVLSEQPAFELEGIEATVRRESCPQPDEPEARELLAGSAARYNRATSSRGIGGFYVAEQRDIDERVLLGDLEGELDPTIAFWEGWPAGTYVEAGRRYLLDDLARARGYAWERVLGGPEYFFGRDRHLNWVYADLDTRSAGHFASPSFAALHTFAVVNEGEDGVRLRFCPGEMLRGRPSLRGTLLIAPDGTMVEAQWRFETPDPDEEAGGWVRFGTVPDPRGGAPHLVAERGAFFRHDGFEKRYPNAPRWYFRDLRTWSGWVVSADGSRPASRRAEEGGR